MSKNESKTLNESFNQINPDILSRLQDLEWLWIDRDLFVQFEKRIKEIIWENPGSEAIIEWELAKTWLWFENLFASYNEKRLPWIIYSAANDDFWNLAA